MTKHFRSRYPSYPDDSDYKTNAPSYYEDLARKEKLIKLLAEKIWDYEEILADSLEEVEAVLEEMLDTIGDGFDLVIEELLVQWIEDGSLDEIINDTLMNKKADKVELEALEEKLDEEMADFIQENNDRLDELEQKVGQELDDKLADLKTSLDDKITYLFKDETMTLFNVQMRDNSKETSKSGLQGGCFLGGSGSNIQYALGFTSIDGNPNNQATIIPANSQELMSSTGGTSLPLGHVNGFDLNQDTDTLYVAHTNKQTADGSEADNRISEVNKSGTRIIRTMTPSGLPHGRRVKWFSYDKATDKKYIGDDLGVFEVDNDLTVLNTINYSDEFLNYRNWGLGQVVAVHHDFIFYLVMGQPTIAVFDLTGKLITLHQLPYITEEGSFTGLGPQAIFFDNDDNLYLTTRASYLSYDLTKIYTKIYKMNPFKGLSSDHYIGTTNIRTPNEIYVTANPQSPFARGTKQYPFHSLEDAMTYAMYNKAQKAFQTTILLKAGRYPETKFHVKGGTVILKGLDDGVKFDTLRIHNSNVILEDITINSTEFDYSLSVINSNVTLKGVKINGNNKKHGININDGSILFGRAGAVNSITNCDTGIYANSSIVVGSTYAFGLNDHAQPIELGGAGYAPLINEGDE